MLNIIEMRIVVNDHIYNFTIFFLQRSLDQGIVARDVNGVYLVQLVKRPKPKSITALQIKTETKIHNRLQNQN